VIQRTLEPRRQFLLGQHAIRAGRAARRQFAVGGDVHVKRDLIRTVTSPPETLAITRLIDGDPVDPGAKACLAAETLNGSEDAKKHFLGEIEGLVAITEQIHRQLNHHPLVFSQQLGVGAFITVGAPLDQRAFATPDIRPDRDASLLHWEVPKRCDTPGNCSHYS